jgi:IS5 family transposase
MKHELGELAGRIDWEHFDEEIAPLCCDKGQPGIASRFVIGLMLLKHIFALSDEEVCERWVYDPYFQYFTGEEFFQHRFPHERSDLSHWRKRLGSKLDLLLAESLRVVHEAGAQRTKDLKRVTVDTTVQPKAITFPTDAKLLHAAIRGLNRLVKEHGVRLRQSYLRVAKPAAMIAGRYAHAKQFNRHRRELRLLRTRLGRIIRDNPPQDRRQGRDRGHLRVAADEGQPDPLPAAAPVRLQALLVLRPEVECIGKGNASAPYEFGVKASIVTTNARARGGQFVLHARALPGNPYDGHTLGAVIGRPKGSPAVRSSAPMSTRDTAATTPPIHAPSSSPARSAACLASSARAPALLGYRSRHRTHEDRRTPRMLLPQGPRGRRRKRQPHRRRSRPSSHPCLAEASLAPHRPRDPTDS